MRTGSSRARSTIAAPSFSSPCRACRGPSRPPGCSGAGRFRRRGRSLPRPRRGWREGRPRSRALVSFMSASVAAPTRMRATPPEILASRSWNFSLSYSLSVSSIWRRSWSIRFWMSARLPSPWMTRGAVLVDLDLLGLAELAEGDVLELQAEVLADRRCRR